MLIVSSKNREVTFSLTFVSVDRITQIWWTQEVCVIGRRSGRWQSITFWNNLVSQTGMYFTNTCSTNALYQHSRKCMFQLSAREFDIKVFKFSVMMR